ncbi:glutathione S-transferase family protein [Acidocella aminolytica]|jgi:glutathione S-transferase|uniref:Beta-etherase n=1 Tax=Acidocella aminolytica 101 = DSM 11237 TaxID=1120923 RepID=A0A0D6PJF8_9PROT|nr:glutathione S-transferase family protein [Acidocella aminolytica]GAN80944.1 beta-etherase [Acidocella aminolytica 101 = DSM 11237]GBQ43311.1 glutathione S-transferase [Acidocella aminolytica 101 = DSM 11237]SHF31639.1 Glutathione S-transferase [Acidocella aminolytica 101 = DSM 11237]
MMTNPIRLYDLAAKDDGIRFSPNCWRVRLALAHKGLPVETIPWRFTEKEAISFSGQGKVPVIVDAGRCVVDSWDIAEYLEVTYPDRPSLFNGAAGHALTRFVNEWTENALHPAIARLILPEIHAMLHPKDQDYFKTTREAFFGCSLDDLAAGREAHLATLRQALRPLAATLAQQAYISGAAAAYADHVVFGALQWLRVCSPHDVTSDQPALADWFTRMLNAYDGLAGAMPAAA